jgi:hypothetical protein
MRRVVAGAPKCLGSVEQPSCDAAGPHMPVAHCPELILAVDDVQVGASGEHAEAERVSKAHERSALAGLQYVVAQAILCQ